MKKRMLILMVEGFVTVTASAMPCVGLNTARSSVGVAKTRCADGTEHCMQWPFKDS